MSNNNLKICGLIGLTLCAITAIAKPYQPPLRALSKEYVMLATAKHVKATDGTKRIIYSFLFDNRSDHTVHAFDIGEESITSDMGVAVVPFKERDVIPFSSPSNWSGSYIPKAEFDEVINEKVAFGWRINNNVDDKRYAIPAKTQMPGYGFSTLRRLPKLLNSFANLSSSRVKYVNNTVEYEMIQLTKADITAPTATLSASIVPTSNKRDVYNINLTVLAKDNYDPLPEIEFTALQDITSGVVNTSPFGAPYTLNTANNIATGAYPTVITVAADAKLSKKYKITYTVTDASDNQTTVSTIVNVPRQGVFSKNGD